MSIESSAAAEQEPVQRFTQRSQITRDSAEGSTTCGDDLTAAPGGPAVADSARANQPVTFQFAKAAIHRRRLEVPVAEPPEPTQQLVSVTGAFVQQRQ